MVVALAEHPLVDEYDLSVLATVFSGAAPLSAELALEAGARLDCEVVQGHGMTELSPVTHATPSGWFKPGSVGVTMPQTETEIVEPCSGESLGIDADGEVWVRGPQAMLGYLPYETFANVPHSRRSVTRSDDPWTCALGGTSMLEYSPMGTPSSVVAGRFASARSTLSPDPGPHLASDWRTRS